MEEEIMDFPGCHFRQIGYVFPEKAECVVHLNVGITH
jgi:hypothetical protein